MPWPFRRPQPDPQPPPPAPRAEPRLAISVSALAAASTKPAPPVTPWTIPQPAPGVGPAGAKIAMDEATADLYAFAASGYGPSIGYGEGLCFIGYPALAELLQRSEYRRLVGTLAQEATRRWIRLTSAGDEDKSERLKQLSAAMKKFRVQDVFREAAEHDSGFGVAHIYLDTGDGDKPEELKKPLPLKPQKIGINGLKRITTVEPIWCYPGRYGTVNPLAPDFYRPQTWYVLDKEIHYTRFMTLVSRQVPDLLKPAFQFGGISLTQLAKPTVDNWLSARQSVSNLLKAFTVWNLQTNMSTVLQGGGSESLVTRAEMFTRFCTNRGLMLTDKDTEVLSNISVPLSGLDHLQAQAQEHQAAVDGMPLTVLLGITPSGLNATGEGEMDAWRDRVRAYQENLFNSPLKRTMDAIQLSEFGDIDPDIGFEWVSLKQPNDVERSTIRKTEADTAVELIGAGVIMPEDERRRLAQSEDSAYHGLDLSDAPDLPEGVDGPDDVGDPLAALLSAPPQPVRPAVP